MKRIMHFAVLLIFSTPAWSQDFTDALRLSDYRLEGTSRAAAMGNAFGALGGDFTSASINPAGLGLYRSNEFALTIRFRESTIDGTFPYDTGNTISESRSKAAVPHLGYVATFNTTGPNSGSLVSINLGVGYNRMNDFNLRKRVKRDDAKSSMLDYWADIANEAGNSTNFNVFLEGLAYETYMINLEKRPDGSDYYNNPIYLSDYGQSQKQSTSHKGSIDEYVISLAANLNHKVYFGFTFGIHDVYFRENMIFSEDDTQKKSDKYEWYDFITYYKTTGTGYNLKFGAIYKPIDQLRLGVALHTPTWYDLTASRQNAMEALAANVYEDSNNETVYEWGVRFHESPLARYSYRLQTPLKGVFSAAGLIGKKGLISVDYEFVNHKKSKFSDGSDGYEYDNENDEIGQMYKAVSNLHIGAEYRVTPAVSLRGGFEYFQSPYKRMYDNYDAHTYTYAGGVGWRSKIFYADLAYKRSVMTDHYSLYYVPTDLTDIALAKYKNKLDNITLTLGVRF